MHSLWSILLQRATPTSVPSLSRNGTILLELKRRHVSQRLNELQITLGQIRRCQQHDSKSKDGTRGRTQTDSGTTQQRDHYSGVDGCSPADGQQQDGIPASQSHSQQTAESTNLSGYKLESHISDRQRSDIVQSSNPDTLPDSQMLQGEDRLVNVPGRQELDSHIAIENTTGHTDIDDWSETRSECQYMLRNVWFLCGPLTVISQCPSFLCLFGPE